MPTGRQKAKMILCKRRKAEISGVVVKGKQSNFSAES
jgi:hypothetical protein